MLVVRVIFAVQLGSCKFTDTDDARGLGHRMPVSGRVVGARRQQGRLDGSWFAARATRGMKSV